MIQKAHCRFLSAIFSAIAVLAALAGPLSALPAAAANEPTGFKNVVLSIYPEYDDPLGIGSPTVLVMLDGQIVGATAPATVRFLVPFTANMYSAGSGPRSQYQGGPPNRKTSDIPGWDEISYELKTGSFVVEYYAPIGTDANRSFSSLFVPLYPVDGLQVVVQQPRQATGFTVVPQSPANEQRSVNSEGFNVLRYIYPGLEARQTLSFDLSYNRTTQSPSLQVKDSASNNGMTIAIVAGAVVLIGFGLYWVLGRPSSKNRRKGRMRGKPAQAAKSAGTRFCPSCGAKMDKATRFCPECGAKQRPE